MINISETTRKGMVSGSFEPQFEELAQQFLNNFNDRDEVGGSVCIRVSGETVVDLWGGLAEPEKDIPWQSDTISVVYSCTKAATALCAHILVDRGILELNQLVSYYWPEFASHGKEKVTVLMLLNHSAGVPAFKEPLKVGAYYDWAYMTDRLANEAPFWEPGTRNGYHMTTFGWTVGELVRLISGQSLGSFFKSEVADPLGIGFWIGLPEKQEQRVAPMINYRANARTPKSDFLTALLREGNSIPHLAFHNSGKHLANSRQAHAAEIGAAGGITNARGLSGMYVPLAAGGKFNGQQFLRPETIVRMSEISTASQRDATLLVPTRFTPGFMKSIDNRSAAPENSDSVILGSQAFGHVGAGGSIGFADPECVLAFGYTMNQMGRGVFLNERGQALVDATYRCLGFNNNIGGVWVR